MNIQEYISSGIVESYVLGLADKKERAEFEQMCAEHPEVKAARDTFEILLEQQALQNAIEPPGYVKSKIFSAIDLKAEPSASPVVPLAVSGNDPGTSTIKRMQYLAAASIILLIASTALNFYFFSQYRSYSVRYDKLLADQQQFAANNNVIQAKLRSYETALNLIKDPNMTMVRMPGSNVTTSPNPNSMATVYWHTRTKDVYLMVNNMPSPAIDKQYQLWAMVDGSPVDAGVIDMNDSTTLVRMKNIPKAQAFAITLEKKGGSPTPTMEQLYVLGYVKT